MYEQLAQTKSIAWIWLTGRPDNLNHSQKLGVPALVRPSSCWDWYLFPICNIFQLQNTWQIMSFYVVVVTISFITYFYKCIFHLHSVLHANCTYSYFSEVDPIIQGVPGTLLVVGPPGLLEKLIDTFALLPFETITSRDAWRSRDAVGARVSVSAGGSCWTLHAAAILPEQANRGRKWMFRIFIGRLCSWCDFMLPES